MTYTPKTWTTGEIITAAELNAIEQGVAAAGGGGIAALTPTATKTASYTAAAGDLAMMNVAGGAAVLNLPAAPANKAQVGYRAIGATAAVPLTINRGGSDTIGTTGATSASIPMPDETVVLQYDAPNTRWLGIANVRTQASMDARYDAAGAAAAVIPTQTGNAGKFLSTDGTAPFWGTPAGSTSPYTVLGNSNGTDDTTAIQTALTAGGYIKGKPGQTYKISAPLVIGAVAGTILDMHGCTVSLNAASNCNMLTTPGVTQGTTVTTRAARVRVFGGVWDRGSNGGTGNAQHNLAFRGVDDLLVRDVTVQSAGGKYAICCEQVSDYTIERIRFGTGAFSDGVHIQGGCFRGTIRDVKGHTGDDCVSITPLDWAAFTWGDEGDVTDLLIEDVEQVNGNARCMVILEGNGKKTQRITVRTVRGAMASNNAFLIGVDTSSVNTATGAAFDQILFEDIIVSVPSTKAIFSIQPDIAVDSITIRDVQIISDLYACVNVNPLSGAIVKRLTVDGVRGATVTAGSPIVQVDTGGGTTGGVARCKISNVDVTMATQSSAFVKARNAGLTLTYLDLVNVVSENHFWLLDLFTTTTVHLTNVTQIGGSGSLVAETAAAVTMYVQNCSLAGSATATGTITSKALGYSIDVSKLTKHAGDLATNTNAGLACGTGPVISDGTVWKNLFSGATA